MDTASKATLPAVPPELLTPYLRQQVRQSAALARQFLVSHEENLATRHDHPDPIGDHIHSPVPGIIHRYDNRVLLLPTMACAATCRFCFRRDRVNAPSPALNAAELDTTLAYISSHPQIHEVILSGGDPLTLPATHLTELLQRIDSIAHVETLRIHTRLPVVAPDRIDRIAQALQQAELGKACWLVLHINHVEELTAPVIAAIKALRSAGMLLLSQSVLLSGVNDNAQALSDLFRKLVALGVKPYYLHQLDRTAGTEHFRVPLAQGRQLMETLRGTLSGFALPTYILEVPGGHGKVWATDAMVQENPNGQGWTIRTPDGATHPYPADRDSAG